MKKKLLVGLMLVSTLVMAEVENYQSEIVKVNNQLEEVLKEENIKWSGVRDLVRKKVDLEAEKEYANLLESMKSGNIQLSSKNEINYSEYQQEKIASLDEKIVYLATNYPTEKNRMKYLVKEKANIKYEAIYKEIVEENPFDYLQVKMFHLF